MAVLSHSEAEKYLSGLNKKVAKIAGELHKILIGEGCFSYVKTIYIGYDFNGAMIAALYGHSEHVEVALALSESFASPILIDASHLTWRTLPVAAVVKTKEDVNSFKVLAESACGGVKSGKHTVNRDAEYFRRSRRERQEKKLNLSSNQNSSKTGPRTSDVRVANKQKKKSK